MFTMQIIKALVATAAALLSVLIPYLGGEPTLAASTTAPASFWSYQDMSGPDHWAELDPSFATCSSGQAQSPINLTAAAAVDLIDPEFHYESVPLNLLNNGHTVQVPYAPGSYILLEGQQYNLLQFHFHSPSEHAIDGKPWDAELHLVHQSKAGELTVVAVLLQGEDAEGNSSYADLSANLPKKLGDKVRTGNMIDARSLLPKATTTYRYKGSLTTPPCSESVTWLVMSKPVSLSTQQLASYQQILNNNNRPLQLLNNRSVQLDSSP
ncbi:MAG: carbonic anhydrase family protein [Cyanobacteria bacterium J06634_5]